MTLSHRLFAQNVRDTRVAPSADVEGAAAVLLSRLLRHAADHVPFYRPLASRLADATRDPDAWGALPVLTALDSRKAADRLLADDLPPQDAALDARSWTTLSTPVEGAYGFLADVADTAQWEYLARRFAVDTTGRLAVILPPASLQPGDLAEPFGPWSLDAPRGRAYRWSEEFASDATLRWLGHLRPDCLFIGPEALEGLLDVAGPGSLRLADILVTRPLRRREARERCQAVFGARPIEAVTHAAGGFVAGMEPDGLFVPALETALVEILDRTGRPSHIGEPGRLVATMLYGYRRIVLRHDLGLQAIWSDKLSACGRRCFEILQDA